MEEARNPPPSASPSKSTRGRSHPTEGKDLISALSDEVILRVFSFLDVNDVVKTSVLSKRWSPLWTKTFAISVEFWKMPGDIDDKISYISGYLAHCTSPAIHKFHLRDLEYHVKMKESIDKLFSMAVERSIKDLCIEFSATSDAYLLPMVLLRCQSLTNLRLSLCRFPYSSIGNLGTTSWKLLKVLSVHHSYMPDEVINVVLEGSPQLESLTLDFCYGMDSIRILSRMMRELVISGYRDPREDLDDDEFQIHRYFVPHEDLRDEDHDKLCLEIFAPYLRTLRLLCSWKGKEVVLLQEASSLVEVELNFSLTLNKTNHDIIDNTMKGILSELHCVDKFIVGNAALEVLRKNKGNGDFSLQLKCRHLTITANEYSVEQIAGVLERAPNVETRRFRFLPFEDGLAKGIFPYQGISQDWSHQEH